MILSDVCLYVWLSVCRVHRA